MSAPLDTVVYLEYDAHACGVVSRLLGAMGDFAVRSCTSVPSLLALAVEPPDLFLIRAAHDAWVTKALLTELRAVPAAKDIPVILIGSGRPALEADDGRQFGVIGSLLNAMEPISMAWQIRALWERHLLQFERANRGPISLGVLIVDPDALQRAAVHFAFKANRFDEVSEADGYRSAFGALYAGSFDLLVVHPPLEETNDCDEFMRRAAAGGVRRFILIAGASTARNAATEQAALAHGLTVLGCLKKPFTMEQLRLLLDRHARLSAAM